MKKILRTFITLFCVVTLLASAVAFADTSNLTPPIVETPNGLLRGFMDEDIYTFYGIQYATAERFEMPVAAEPWEGVKNAQVYGPISPFLHSTTPGEDEFVWPHRYWIENENCQYLNVWTTSVDTEAKKPVMVFLHGGGYYNGSSVEAVAYDGHNLSEYGDVVVVTVNHRLNALGYLDLSSFGEEYADSVHVGWADLVMALEWVQKNIASFGGDPDNVTLFGQSGGGGKVLTLMHIPEAEGLFDKAISHSSGSGAKFGLSEKKHAQRIGELTVEYLGLDAANVDEIKNVTYDALITAATAAVEQTKVEYPESASYIGWNPIVDDGYLKADYCDWTLDMPFITGSVMSESNRASYKASICDGRLNEWTDEEGIAKVKELYGDSADAIMEEFGKLFPELPEWYVYFFSASGRDNIKKVAEIMRDVGNEGRPVYEYFFDYEAPVNGGTTAFHCVDLIYVFHNVEIPILQIATGAEPEAYELQDNMAGAWIAFARTGNPSQEGLEWQPYTEENDETMFFGAESGMRSYDDTLLRELINNA